MPDNPKWFPKIRKSIKSLPTAEDYRKKRRLRMRMEQQARRNALIWKRRTETYRVDINGVFTGSYYRPPGQTILVRGNTKAQIRYEAVRGANPLRWIRVRYEAP